jgi:hypothetical protein
MHATVKNSSCLVAQDVQLPPKAGSIDSFFQQQVQTLQQSLNGFDARLAWYVPNAVLPAAEIGDPAKDFKSSGRFGDGHCGTFRPGVFKSWTLNQAKPRLLTRLPFNSVCGHLQVLTCRMTSAQRPVAQRQMRLHSCAVDTLRTWSPTARELLLLSCCPADVQSLLLLQIASFHDRISDVLSALHCRSARSERSRVSTVVISPRLARLPVRCAACTISDLTLKLGNALLLRLMLHVSLCRMEFGRQCSCTSWAIALMCMCMEGAPAQSLVSVSTFRPAGCGKPVHGI